MEFMDILISNYMNIIFVFLGMSTLLVFLYKREWLLGRRPFLILLVLNVILFILGYILENGVDFKLSVALKMGLLSQLIFTALVTLFRRIYKRDPVDTFWTMDVSLMKDGIFNFVFWVLGGVIPALIVFKHII